MKILHIVPTYLPAYRYGGPIKTVHELNKRLAKKGCEATVYTTNIDGEGVSNVPLGEEVNIDGVKVFYFPVSFRPWQYSCRLRRALAKNINDFDLVHITSVFLSASTLGAYYAKKFNKPYIISPRGSLMAEPLKKSGLKKKIYLSLVEKKNLANASAIHFTTEMEKEEYLKAGLPLKKAIVIPNGIEREAAQNLTRNYAEKSFRKKFGIFSDKKIVLFLSRISWKKGLDTLIPSFAEVIKKKPKTILVIAGGDDEGYGKTAKELIMEWKLENKIIFTGQILGDDKIAAYRESDVFVLPSYSENFGQVVVEAMAAGLPVVITKNVGVAPSVERAGAGIVIEKDEKQLTEAILKILENPQLAKKMGEQGKKLVETEFSWPEIAEKFAAEYEKLIVDKT